MIGQFLALLTFVVACRLYVAVEEHVCARRVPVRVRRDD
jgi:hypothetical protein